MTYTEFDLRTAMHLGERVVTFPSLILAVTKLADDYKADGEDEISAAFWRFAVSLMREGRK